MKARAFGWFQDPAVRLGRARAREWMRTNGLDLERALDLGRKGIGPDVYGRRFAEEGLLETVAVVETAESVLLPIALNRMRVCEEWSRGSDLRKKILFIPRASVSYAAETLTEYDASVVY